MGLDVTMYALLDEKPSKALMEEFAEFMFSRLYVAKDEASSQEFGDYLEPPRVIDCDGPDFGYVKRWCVELYTLGRYWGPGYERGDWPRIYACWLGFDKYFPGKVYYHSDSLVPGEPADPFTISHANAFWSHWLSDSGDDYRQSFVQRGLLGA